LLTVTLMTAKRGVPDAVCAEAVDAARAALLESVDPETVGEHLGVEADGERVVAHLFAANMPGYRGWRWAVTVMRASRARTVTVGETVLLPGPEALLPPAWVPWTERLRPGDLGVGDLLPTDEDDPRLEPGWNAGAISSGDDEIDDPDAEVGLAVAVELDLVRPRVLSPIGIDDAVDRWQAGDHGPDAPMAQAAPARCATCGFRLPVHGRLGHAFGLCANELSPSDGHVVALDFGCGAHSEAVVVPTMADRPAPVIDEVGFETVEVPDAVEVETVETVETVEATDAVEVPDAAEAPAVEPVDA
jgi:hypothetical protein